ncbi:MAG: Gfo/Idh/MocA family oxidoreductase [Caldilineaceae bacterium]|nr:Gfo/Idh/MocA family oxidoreductase [Caldilineaceae bacterium]
MSLYLDEALEMEKIIANADILSTVGFQQRFETRNEAVKSFLADKQVVMADYTLHAPLEAHSVKHMQTETVGGPKNRVWTASRAWSGGTMVEAGIHPLDLWRYWFGDVEWVQASYVHRPPEAIIDGADNPYAYDATFGFANGAIGNLTLSRLRRVFHSDFAHRVLWDEGHLHLDQDEFVSYHYDGDYPPAQRPDPASLRSVLPVAPARNSTDAIADAFVRAIAEDRPELIRSPFGDAMNSLAAVIGANISDELGGMRIQLHDLLNADQFSEHRRKPE